MINSVRNTVLAVLNKNNYGYLSPSDFNLYAQQAQMEMFDEYFSNYNKTVNMENVRSSGTDYANIGKTIAELMDAFVVTKPLVPYPTASGFATNRFFMPSLVTTGDEAYMIAKLVYYPNIVVSSTNTSTSTDQLIDSSVDFQTLGVSVGDIVVNATNYTSSKVYAVVNATTLDLGDDIFTASGDDYIIYSAASYSDAEMVSNGKITMLTNSLLTSPSTLFPAYTIEDSYLNMYPTSISTYGAVHASYFRYPKPPKWTYISLASGQPIFDQTQPDYQDFELPQEDEFKLVMKILQYAGMEIREADIANFGAAQEQHEQPTFSQQQ